jgi:hypothetical protein
MGLPCAFTNKLHTREHVAVCGHVWEENIRDGAPLSCFRGQFWRDTPPKKVIYEDGSISQIAVTITCENCDPKSEEIDLVEFVWDGEQLVMTAAAKGAA